MLKLNKQERYLINTFLETTNIDIVDINKFNDKLSLFIKKLMNAERLEYVAGEITDFANFESMKEAKKIVDVLYYYYLLFNSNVEINKKDDYFNRFLNDKNYALFLLNNYYSYALNKENNIATENKIKINNEDRFNKLNYYSYIAYGLNDYLKDILIEIYSKFSVADEDKLSNAIVRYLNGDINIIKNNEIKEKLDIIKNIKPYFVKIMYTDLYELSINNDDNYDDSGEIIEKILESDRISFDEKELLNDRLLTTYFHYVFMLNERKNQRDKLNNNQLKLVRKHNPLYFLDEL